MIEPRRLHIVEAGSVARTFLQVEELHQLVHGENLAVVVAGIPAQQGQEVHHGLGQIALLPIAAAHLARPRVVPFEGEDGESQLVSITLAQLAVAYRLEQQRQMGKAGHRVLPAECLVEQDVERCRGEPFLATDDMRYLHEVIVHDVGQMISGQLVGTLIEHLVVQDARVDAHLASNQVVHQHLASRLDEEAHDVLLPAVYHALHLVGREGERVAHLHAGRGIVLEVLYLAALGLQLLGSVEGVIGTTGIYQLPDVLLVYLAALTLAVGAVIASEAHALVKLDTQPAEGFDDIFLGSRHKARRVCILDAEHQVAPMLAGEQIVVQCRAHTANMLFSLSCLIFRYSAQKYTFFFRQTSFFCIFASD